MSSPPAAAAADAFMGGRLRLVQPESGHRAGLDAVMLAAAAPVAAGDRVLDAGTGAGVVGLCIAQRVPGCVVTGIEIEAGLAKLAASNAKRNGLGQRYRAVCADLTLPLTQLECHGLQRESFEVAVANPPFYGSGRGSPSSDPGRRRASVMPEGGLESWVRTLTAMTVAGGALVLVHQAAALADILAALKDRCGAVTVLPLFPRAGEPAHRLLVAARKGSRAPMVLRRGLVLHGAGNAFTPEAEAVLRHGAALDLTS